MKLDFYDSFVNQLVSYFADDEDEAAIKRLRADFRRNPRVRQAWSEGLDGLVVEPPPFDRVKLVRNFANRGVSDDAEALAWLVEIKVALFDEPAG